MSRKQYLAAMYLRLSREDEATCGGADTGSVKDGEGRAGKSSFPRSESNSIGNQREMIRAFIH